MHLKFDKLFISEISIDNQISFNDLFRLQTFKEKNQFSSPEEYFAFKFGEFNFANFGVYENTSSFKISHWINGKNINFVLKFKENIQKIVEISIFLTEKNWKSDKFEMEFLKMYLKNMLKIESEA